MKLIELAQAIEDGKLIQIDVQNAPMGHAPWPPGGRWRVASETNIILPYWLNLPNSVRIAPELKPIDLSVLIQSGIDCEFSISSRFDDPAVGKLTVIMECTDPYTRDGKVGHRTCQPRMGDHWHSWQGGKCPLPEGLVVEVTFRGGEKRQGMYDRYRWGHNKTRLPNDIIAFRVLDKADTHCWPWECES